MSVHHTNAWCLWRSEDGIRSPGSGVADSCEPPCGGWDLNPGPLEEQPVILTTEPPPQSQAYMLKMAISLSGFASSCLLRVVFHCLSHRQGKDTWGNPAVKRQGVHPEAGPTVVLRRFSKLACNGPGFSSCLAIFTRAIHAVWNAPCSPPSPRKDTWSLSQETGLQHAPLTRHCE